MDIFWNCTFRKAFWVGLEMEGEGSYCDGAYVLGGVQAV